MPATQTKPLFEQIDSWLSEANEIKAAAAKKQPVASKKTAANVLTKRAIEGVGQSDHPSDDVDDKLHEAPEGERFRENSEDVKKDIPANVDEAPEGVNADQDKVMPNIGTQQAATGEHDEVETGSAKGSKEDPGTDHPANTEDIGEKYSSMKLRELLKMAADKTNKLLAHIAAGHFSDVPELHQQVKAAEATGVPAKRAVEQIVQQAVQQNQEGMITKEAADEAAATFIAQTIRDAEFDADLVGPFAVTYLQKYAMPAPMGDEGAGEGEIPPEVLAAMAGGGGGAGASPDAALAGGDEGEEAVAPEGMPEGVPGGGGAPGAGIMEAMQAGVDENAGGEPSPTEAMTDLVSALEELGIDPAMLAQLAQEKGNGDQGAKIAAAVRNFKLAGKYRMAEPKTANERGRRDQMKEYVRDLIGISA